MLIPLVFAVIMQAYHEDLPRWILLGLRGFGYLLFTAVLAADIGSYFPDDTQLVPYLGLKVTVLAIVILGVAWYYYRKPKEYLFVMVVALLLFRLGVDLYALPARAENGSLHRRRASVEEFAARWQEKELAVFYNTSMEMASSFYLQNNLQRVVPRRPLNDLRLN